MTNLDFIDTESINYEKLSAEQFLKLIRTNPSSIKTAKPAPARLGSNDFGSIIVKYKRPVYKTVF